MDLGYATVTIQHKYVSFKLSISQFLTQIQILASGVMCFMDVAGCTAQLRGSSYASPQSPDKIMGQYFKSDHDHLRFLSNPLSLPSNYSTVYIPIYS